MYNFIISLILGMLPEVLFYTLFLTYAKNLKEKRIKLFVLLAVGYIALIMICRYEFIFYIAYIVYGYVILKVLYKAHIIDLFTFIIPVSYLMLCSFICYFLIDNYIISLIVNRLILIIPILCINYKLNYLYNKYRLKWNRHNNGGIKSITIRNISLLMTNVFIVVTYITLIIVLSHYME